MIRSMTNVVSVHFILLQPVKFTAVFQKGGSSNFAVVVSRGNVYLTVLGIYFKPTPGVVTRVF